MGAIPLKKSGAAGGFEIVEALLDFLAQQRGFDFSGYKRPSL